MYVRPCYRKKSGKRHAYRALVESYRTERGPRQRVVAYLGEMDEQGRLGVKRAAERKSSRQKRLFDDVEPRWVEVDAEALRVERECEFGGPWLARELLRKIGLAELINRTVPSGREDIPWRLMAEGATRGRRDCSTSRSKATGRKAPGSSGRRWTSGATGRARAKAATCC